MRKHTRHRRLVRGLGALVSATLITSGLAVGLGAGVASAEGSSDWTLAPNTAPSDLRQNTEGDLAPAPISGAGAGWTFQVDGDWEVGDQIYVSVRPNTTPFGLTGANCATPVFPPGVNQETADLSNWIGFSTDDFPTVESTFPAGAAPTFTVSVDGQIGCSNFGGGPAYQFLVLTATNDGNGQASQKGTVRIGWSTDPGLNPNPVLFDVGFGATTGPAHFDGWYGMPDFDKTKLTIDDDPDFAVESSVTVVGQRPLANEPRKTLVRNTATDAIDGAISEFTITENVDEALPPLGTDAAKTLQPTSVPGNVCVEIQNDTQGNDVRFDPLDLPTWSVDVGASASGNTAAAGGRDVEVFGGPEGSDSILSLPVENSSNKTPTVWTTTGLNLTGTAYTDGPVWARVFWVSGAGAEAPNCEDMAYAYAYEPAGITVADVYELGQVQLTTVSELAKTVAGATAVDTAAAAIDHQFDSAKGHCVGSSFSRRGPGEGGGIFLARDDHYADGLGAAYSAGSINSGVLLTNPKQLSDAARRQIRLQGVQTVYVVGGPLAISDDVVAELEALTAYECGGGDTRKDPDTGKAKKLIVERIFGQNLYDTNQQLAQYVGAQVPAAFPAFGVWDEDTNVFNKTTGASFAGTAPASQVNTALLVTGENFQDAMVGSVPAYGGGYTSWICLGAEVTGLDDQRECDQVFGGPMPLIATDGDTLSPQAVAAMQNQRIEQLIVLGGPMAISDSVMQEAVNAVPGLGAIRIAGQTAVETSTMLASFELSSTHGMGWLNVDFDWDSYVNRTAGNINFNTNDDVTAHTVLLARGDYFADAMAAAAVLSVHNGRWTENPQKFPLVISESPTSASTPLFEFFYRSSLWFSVLPGAYPALGATTDCDWDDTEVGCNDNDLSSSIFTVQPIGGNLALDPGMLNLVVTAVIGGGPNL